MYCDTITFKEIKCNKKFLGRIGLIYGLIVSLVNYLGYTITSSGQMPFRQTNDYLLWLEFMSNHSLIINTMVVASFVIPVTVCVLYVEICKPEDVQRKIKLAIMIKQWMLSVVMTLEN